MRSDSRFPDGWWLFNFQAGYVEGLLAEYRGREVAALRFLRDKYTKPKPAAKPTTRTLTKELVAARGGATDFSRSVRTDQTMSVGSNGSSVNSFSSDWDDSDDDDDEAVDEMILKQFMARLKTTLASE